MFLQDIDSRSGPLLPNDLLTQIFIKYMHDIVLKISFLDIHSQNCNTGSHLKLWQESVKIVYRTGVNKYQILVHVVDGHEKTDF